MRTAQELGALVRDQRRAAGLTQQELAERAHVTRQWVARLEKGHDRAELDPLLRTLEQLDLELAMQPRVPSGRVHFRDVKPYDAAGSLDVLCGPSSGLLELPHWIYWGPEQTVDLDSPVEVRKAYQAIVREGTSHDQTRLLDRATLIAVWSDLVLPERVRSLWEGSFLELASARAALTRSSSSGGSRVEPSR